MSMELIDREKLLDELGESASYHAEDGREYQLLLRDRNIVREQKEVKAIPIPKDATNGDMFMLTYPTSIVAPNKERGLDVTVFLNEAVIFETWFPITWWNAPYKESENE